MPFIIFMDGVPVIKSIDLYNQALIACHKRLYQSSVMQEDGRNIPSSVYLETVELTIIEYKIKKKILKQNFRQSISKGCLLKIK